MYILAGIYKEKGPSPKWLKTKLLIILTSNYWSGN